MHRSGDTTIDRTKGHKALPGILGLVLRVAVSAVLLYLATRRVALSVVLQRLSSTDLTWLTAAVFSLTIQIVPIGLRWSIISTDCGWPLSAMRAIRYSAIGFFFNQTLPSTVGGDAFRIWYLRREGSRWAPATYSVLIDRAIGMSSLALITLFSTPWIFSLVPDVTARAVILAAALISISGFLAFLAASFLDRIWPRLSRLWPIFHVTEASAAARRLLASAPDSARAVAYSVAGYLLSTLAWWCTAKAIDVPFSFANAILLVPPISLISTVPVSIAGWGVRESAVIALLAYVDIPEADALLMSIVFGLVSFAAGLPGGAAWIARGDVTPIGDTR